MSEWIMIYNNGILLNIVQTSASHWREEGPPKRSPFFYQLEILNRCVSGSSSSSLLRSVSRVHGLGAVFVWQCLVGWFLMGTDGLRREKRGGKRKAKLLDPAAHERQPHNLICCARSEDDAFARIIRRVDLNGRKRSALQSTSARQR